MDNKPSSDPQESKLSSGESNENVSAEEKSSKLAAEINAAIGFEKYQSDEDALRGVAELNKFTTELGPLKEKAQKYDELVAKQTPSDKAKVVENEFYKKVDQMDFLRKNPGADSVVDDVYALSKQRGVSMDDVFKTSPLKKVVETERASQQAANPQFTESGQRLPKGTKSFTLDEFRNFSSEEKRKIVEGTSLWKNMERGAFPQK